MKTSQDIRRVVVVGTGQMGPGIAYTVASAGCKAILYGRSRESLERGSATFRAAVDALLECGCISREEAACIRDSFSVTDTLEDAVADADLVIESIVEDLAIKQKFFARVEKSCPPDAVLTSNTSGLPVTQLAAALERPARFAVTHFWNPPHLMPLVEVVKGERTAQNTIDTLVELFKAAGKEPVAVMKDTPGQLGNRLFHALIREAIWIVEQGIASAEDVDKAMKSGFGRRLPVYGALEHQDIVGLDLVSAIQGYMCKALCSEKEQAALLKNLVADSRLGVKTGRGFYDWKRHDAGAVVRKRDEFLIDMLKKK